MKIKVKSEEMKFPIYFLFPSVLVRAIVCSRPAAYAIARQLRQKENLPPIPLENIRKMQKTLRKCLKKHRGLEFADIESANGERVKIVL